MTLSKVTNIYGSRYTQVCIAFQKSCIRMYKCARVQARQHSILLIFSYLANWVSIRWCFNIVFIFLSHYFWGWNVFHTPINHLWNFSAHILWYLNYWSYWPHQFERVLSVFIIKHVILQGSLRFKYSCPCCCIHDSIWTVVGMSTLQTLKLRE